MTPLGPLFAKVALLEFGKVGAVPIKQMGRHLLSNEVCPSNQLRSEAGKLLLREVRLEEELCSKGAVGDPRL